MGNTIAVRHDLIQQLLKLFTYM